MGGGETNYLSAGRGNCRLPDDLRHPIHTHKMFFDPVDLRKDRVAIGEWEIQLTKGPISGADEIDSFCRALHTLNAPEMFFGNNSISITHRRSGRCLTLSTRGALQSCGRVSDVEVKGAEAWKKSRGLDGERRNQDGPAGALDPVPVPEKTAETEAGRAAGLKEERSYLPDGHIDWTFSPIRYGGELHDRSGCPIPVAATASDGSGFDRALLLRRDPILLFDEIDFFESELDDNGISRLFAKIRVMNTCLFVLLRFFLRVDGVVMRVFDCRLFAKLGESFITREFQQREVSLKDGSDFLCRLAAASNPLHRIEDPTPFVDAMSTVSSSFDRVDMD